MMTATLTSMSNFVTPGDIRARVRWIKEALGELGDELERLEELIDEPSGEEREERGMEPLMYGEDLGGFFILKWAERHMRWVEKGADGLKVAAGILRAQALTYLRGKHGPKNLDGQGGTRAFERGSSFLDSNTSTYTDMDSDSNSSPTHSPQLSPTTPNSPASSYFMLPPNEEAADHCSAALAYAACA